MKPRTTLLLLVVVLALAAFVRFWEKDRKGTLELRAERGRLFPDLQTGLFDTLTIERPGLKIVAAKRGEQWRLTSPVDDRADRNVVEGLIRDVVQARERTRLTASEIQGGEATTGLGATARHITLTGQGTSVRLSVGSTDAPGDLRYARVGDSGDIVLVDATVRTVAEKPVDDLRDRSLFDLSSIDVGTLRIERDGATALEFRRPGTDEWRIAQPLDDAADGVAVEGLLAKLLALRADAFRTDDAAGTLSSPSCRVTLLGRKGEPSATLDLGDVVAAVPARRVGRVSGRSAVFETSAAEFLRQIESPADNWRSKSAIDVSPWDVAHLELTRAGVSLKLDRSASEADADKPWTVVQPPGFALDTARASTLVQEIAHLAAKRLVDDVTPEAAGLHPPQARLVLVPREPSRFARVELDIGGSAGAGELYARRSDRRGLLVIDESAVKALDPASLKKQ